MRAQWRTRRSNAEDMRAIRAALTTRHPVAVSLLTVGPGGSPFVVMVEPADPADLSDLSGFGRRARISRCNEAPARKARAARPAMEPKRVINSAGTVPSTEGHAG